MKWYLFDLYNMQHASIWCMFYVNGGERWKMKDVALEINSAAKVYNVKNTEFASQFHFERLQF